MGRRAKKQKVQTKKREKVATLFKCPFCNHNEVVEVKLEMTKGTGKCACRICGASFQMPINYLSQAIDVFCEWLDECEKVQATGVNSGNLPAKEEDEEEDVLGGEVGQPRRVVRNDGEGNSGGVSTLVDNVGDVDSDDDELPPSYKDSSSSSSSSSSSAAATTTTATTAETDEKEDGGKRKAAYANLGFSDDSDSDED